MLTRPPARLQWGVFPVWRFPPGTAVCPPYRRPRFGSVLLEEAMQKADVLIEALQWIRQFRGKVTVIKLGGSVMEDDRAMIHLLLDVVFMETVGMRPVVVHGGGAAISRAMAEAGLQPQFVQGRRYTDAATLAIVERVLGRRGQRAPGPPHRRTRRPGQAAELPHQQRPVRRTDRAARRERRPGGPGLRGHRDPRGSGGDRGTLPIRHRARHPVDVHDARMGRN